MSRLTRLLDAEYERGKGHGFSGMAARDPGRRQFDPVYAQWAYNAGWTKGRRDLEQLRQALNIGDAGAQGATSAQVGP